MFAICPLSLVPVRRDPADQSEMISQLLFGEMSEVIGEHKNWRKVRMLFDDYTGWVDKKQLRPLTEEEMQTILAAPSYVSTDLFQLIIWNKNQVCPIAIGSSLPNYSNHKFFIGQTEYLFEGNTAETVTPDPKRLLEQAYMFLNAPYLWGGRSPFGIDCSGLTQMAFKLCGMSLRRDAIQQSEQGDTVPSLEASKPGDLAFFSNDEGRISHVGIILPGGYIIHASGRVRIDKLDTRGIYNAESEEYSHPLKLIKRLF